MKLFFVFTATFFHLKYGIYELQFKTIITTKKNYYNYG